MSDEDRNLLTANTEVIAMLPSTSSGTDDVGTLVAAWKNTGTAVAYFDDGTVFSSKIGSEIEDNMTLTDVSGLDPVNPGKIIIDYTNLADPLTDIPPVERNFTITGNVITCVSAISATNNGIRLNSVIVKTRSAGGSEDTVLSKSPALEAAQSESFYIHANCNLADINKDKKCSMYKVATMAFESAQLAGDGLITKDGSDFNYSYFLKDHLGSTRMVLNQAGEIKQALMYQPYGTTEPVSGIPGTGTDPLRQKFTTKEFDEDGDLNGASGIKAYHFGARMYNPDLRLWYRPDPLLQDWNVYAYCGLNPINSIDPDGAKWWQWALGAVADAMSGGLFSVTSGATAVATAAIGMSSAGAAAIGFAGVGTGLGGVAFAHFTNPASYIDPIPYQLLGGINNTIHNSQGIDNFGEGISSFFFRNGFRYC